MSLYFDNEKLFDAEGHLTDEGLYALKDGEIYARGTAGEILTEENLEKIFSIEASVREDENCKRPFFLPIRSLNNITAM